MSQRSVFSLQIYLCCLESSQKYTNNTNKKILLSIVYCTASESVAKFDALQSNIYTDTDNWTILMLLIRVVRTVVNTELCDVFHFNISANTLQSVYVCVS